jgi:ABC-type lipoprotein export system ATPase subunit
MIETINLTKIYNKGKKHQVEAVTEANIVAKNGEITALVGQADGKTTLMSMIGQL